MTLVTCPPAVAGTTTTAGTGPFVISGPLAVPVAGGNYRQWSTVANGAKVHCVRGDSGLANFERGYVTVSNISGTVTLTWASRLETSAGGATPVTWPGGGTQNVWTVPEAISPANAMAEYGPYLAASRAELGLPTVADVGAVTGAVVTLTGALIASALLPAGAAPSVPSASVTVWYQAAAPSGWTRITTYDDCVISITNSSGIGGGGPFAAGTFVPGGWDPTLGMSINGHAITIAEMAAHTHAAGIGNFITDAGSTSFAAPAMGSAWGILGATTSVGAGAAHAHTLANASTWRPPALKMLLASKN